MAHKRNDKLGKRKCVYYIGLGLFMIVVTVHLPPKVLPQYIN